MEIAAEFERYRPVLLGLAYRLLGSMWDAEDVVQEAWLRWEHTDQDAVREPHAFLTTVVSRLALDQLRSARVTREAYRGPWLPEPVLTDDLGPLETVELKDTVSYATVHLMERLTPPERAVFVLREAFRMPYGEIAEAVGVSPANARQLHHRARGRIAAGAERFKPSAGEHERLLTRFLDAARGGDFGALTELLSEDVVAWSDGGGKVRAARRPVVGRANVAAFLRGLVTRYGPLPDARLIDANGAPALWISMAGADQVVSLDVRDGRIHGIYTVLNPDKLRRVRAALADDA
ncbi:RNA polymerase sigma-70 factor [Streptomyces sp. WMMC500]|uniref:RNA polymerase sigma-70 factor n=1 Tax=Streptomyces sp. WMMC500 TaxID=3015154 RepID=UPI00248BB526|nr:RNA polymerase sigma-70 factor [Streptomyces sp. WMMC500]WBB61400.1 RNA polymerase sigma-70 factor [Streptomyces sp. WMMC500]